VHDQPRYIAPGAGYTHWRASAADKLEAIRADEQDEQTRRAQLLWAKEQQRRWGEAAKTINGAVEHFAAAGVDRRLASDLQVITRQTERVRARLERLDA
jgi:hypothetical protein